MNIPTQREAAPAESLSDHLGDGDPADGAYEGDVPATPAVEMGPRSSWPLGDLAEMVLNQYGIET